MIQVRTVHRRLRKIHSPQLLSPARTPFLSRPWGCRLLRFKIWPGCMRLTLFQISSNLKQGQNRLCATYEALEMRLMCGHNTSKPTRRPEPDTRKAGMFCRTAWTKSTEARCTIGMKVSRPGSLVIPTEALNQVRRAPVHPCLPIG